MQIKTITTSLFAAALAIGLGQATFAATIPVANASFEAGATPHAVGAGAWGSVATGWTVTGTAGTFDPNEPAVVIDVPDGNKVAFVNGGHISQTVAATIVPDITYILSVMVGSRADGVPFGGYSVSLLAGNNTLVSTHNSPLPSAPGTFTDVTLYYKVAAGDANIGSPLTIQLAASGPQVLFDNVRLDAVPEPSTYALLGAGLVGIYLLGRRQQKLNA